MTGLGAAWVTVKQIGHAASIERRDFYIIHCPHLAMLSCSLTVLSTVRTSPGYIELIPDRLQHIAFLTWIFWVDPWPSSAHCGPHLDMLSWSLTVFSTVRTVSKVKKSQTTGSPPPLLSPKILSLRPQRLLRLALVVSLAGWRSTSPILSFFTRGAEAGR